MPDARHFQIQGAFLRSRGRSSELIPCIPPQTHEIELTVRNPHRCGCCYLSALFGLGVMKNPAEIKSELIRRGLLIQAN
jgi:hypothetical protein